MTKAARNAGAGFPFHTILFAVVLCLGLAAAGQLLMPPSGDLNAHRAEKEKTLQERQKINAEMHLLFEVADLIAMAGEATRADFLNLAYDRGEQKYGAPQRFLPDGIPDAAQVALLEAVLKDSLYERGRTGGGSHEYVWQSFRENMALAQDKLPDFDARVHRALAALLTLGWDHAPLAAHVARQISGRETDFSDHATTAYRWLNAEDDLENDGNDNIDEWNAAVAESGPDATPLELLERFIRLAAREEKNR